jgi:hypothetical protein
MTNLQYEDSGYRKKQEQKEKDEFAIGFAEWYDMYGMRTQTTEYNL